jgi:hypothetical protein
VTITTERPSSVASLQDKRDIIEDDLAAKKAKIVELAREQDEARKSEILGDEKRTGATSKVHQIGRKIRELDSEIASLEADLTLVIDLLVTETHIETQVKIAASMEQAEEMKEVERRLWKDLVVAFEAFGDAWLALRDHYRSWAELRGSHRWLGGEIPPESRGRWDIVWSPAVRPPINAASAFSMLYDVLVRWPKGHFPSPPHATGELGDLTSDLSHFDASLEVPGDVQSHTAR